MAVRFDAAADRLLRTASVLDYNSAYTWMCWFHAVTDTNADSTILMIANSTSMPNNSDWIQIRFGPAVSIMQIGQGDGGAFFSTDGTIQIFAGIWYHIAAVRESATSHKLYLNGELEATLTNDITGRTASNRQESGAWGTGNADRFDGRIAYIKAWSRALTIDEVKNEMNVIRPIHPNSLWGWWPAWHNQRTKDYSGNARDLTAGGTLTDEDPPNTPFGQDVWLVIQPAAAAGDQTIEPGGIASTLAFGTGKLNRTIVAQGIASAFASGTPKLNLRLLLTGLASGLTFGTAKLNREITATAIASSLQFGTTQVLLDTDQTIEPSAIASTLALGTPKLNLEIAPSGIASTFAAGTPKLNLRLLVSAIASTLGFGTPNVIISGAIAPSGIASTLAFGTAKLNLEITAQGISSTNAFGTAILNVLQSILPGSIAPGTVFGTPKLNYRILAIGIAPTSAIGSPTITFPGAGAILGPSGVASTLQFGTLSLVLVVTGVAPEECPADWTIDTLPAVAFTRIASPEDTAVTEFSDVESPSDPVITPSTGPY